jgi:hypothetical protein
MRFEASVLLGKPVSKLAFEGPRARDATGFAVVGWERLVLLGWRDHAVELAHLLNEHRLAVGLGAKAAKPFLGLCLGNAHDPLLLDLSTLVSLGARAC